MSDVKAETIDKLISQGELTLSSKVLNDDNHIVGQPFTIAIEVATNRWFSGGTSIENFSLADTVILPNESTINGNKRINGATWSSQIREIIIYPIHSGILQIPEIKVNISVNTEQYGVIEGFAYTEKQAISITLPSALKNISHYVVSPQLTLDIDESFDEEIPYAIGDAITQTITLIAKDTPAMMIPPVIFPKIEGVNIYQKPSQVFDKSNRGNLIGTRIESFTFIFEQPGSYQLEQQTIYWWDTQNKRLKELVIPASQWSVSGKSSVKIGQTNWLVALLNKNLIFLGSSLLIIAFIISIIYRYKLQLKQFYQRISQQQKRHAAKEFVEAVKKQNYPLACQKLFNFSMVVNSQQVLHPETIVESVEANQLVERLNTLAFDRQGADTLPSISSNEAKKLLRLISSPINKKNKPNSIGLKIDLNS